MSVVPVEGRASTMGLRRPWARRAASRLGTTIGLVVGAMVLAACGATPAVVASGGSTAGGAAQYVTDTVPSAAKMICSADIRRQIAGALHVPSISAPASTWAAHVYTCAYSLPVGRLVLLVTVASSNDAAAGQLAAMRSRLGSTEEEPGLGTQGYSTPTGIVIAVKDNMVLRVDATALPDDLGTAHEKRVDFARVIAAAVFSCWTGNG